MSITLPHDASLHGHRVDAVLRYLIISTTFCMAIMAGILLVAVLFHRGRARQALYTHGNRRRDRLAAVLAGAVVLFAIDAVAVVRSSNGLRIGFWHSPDQDPRAVRVEVTAQQWVWTFRYPGADGRFNTNDDIVTLNELRVPVDRPITLQLTSKDVVHALYLPNFRNKVDAIPGTVTRMWFQASETGLFEIGCAQHCGAWHYKMRGELTVMDADGYARWLARAALDTSLGANAGAKTPDGAEAGAPPRPQTSAQTETQGPPQAQTQVPGQANAQTQTQGAEPTQAQTQVPGPTQAQTQTQTQVPGPTQAQIQVPVQAQAGTDDGWPWKAAP